MITVSFDLHLISNNFNNIENINYDCIDFTPYFHNFICKKESHQIVCTIYYVLCNEIVYIFDYWDKGNLENLMKRLNKFFCS